jgi:hypothetical protein
MPRKIRPKYGIDPVQEVPAFSFTDAQIEHLFKALAPVKGDREQIIADLVSCARDYRWLRNQNREKPTRAEQNAALKEIGQLAWDLAVRLRSIDMDTQWELMSKHPAFHSGDFTEAITNLTDQLEDFEDAADQALRAGKMKSGPRSPIWIQRIVVRLADLYEKFTGKSFSHNPKQLTQYDGEPRSKAGRFIVTFFEIVDPSVTPQSISTAMASIIKSRSSGQKPAAS